MRARVPGGRRRLVSGSANGAAAAHSGNRSGKAKIDPPPGLSASVSSPPMRRTSSREIASPRPAPSKRRACEPSPCSKLSKIAARRSAGHPGSGVGHRELRHAVFAALDRHADAALIGEFDRIAGEIGENLAQTLAVGANEARRGGAERGGDLDALALGARREQFDDALGEPAQIDRLDDEIESARLDLGQIEDLVDQRDERAPRAADRFHVACVFGIKRGVPQQVGHAENAADRGADFVAHRRQKARFGLARRLCPVTRARRFLEPPEFVAQPIVLGGDPAPPRFRLAPRRATPAASAMAKAATAPACRHSA